jgi:serine/threonine-protein kinase
VAVWSIVGVLLLALISTGTWWFTTGRWTDVPRVDGVSSADAERMLAGADLNPKTTQVRDNEVAFGIVIRTEPAGGGRALRGDQVTLVVSAGKPRVPDVRPGTTVEAAQQAILAEDLRPQRDDGSNEYHDTAAKGQVIKLNPPAGTQLNIGQSVTIVVSDGPRPKPVPDVRGKTREEAFQALSAAGFEPYDAGQEFSDLDGGRVVRTSPAANTEMKNGQSTRVGVVVSNAVTVPDLSTQLATDATSALQALGLAPQVQPVGPAAPTNRVIAQSPAPTSRVQPGSAVVLLVYG